MSLDLSLKFTDLAIIFATLLGPILAVYASDYRRKKDEARERRAKIFRTMMAYRSLPTAPAHVEAINLIDQEFSTSKATDRAVIEAWKLFRRHLDVPFNETTWEDQRRALYVELLSAISNALGYGFAKSDIMVGTYSPVAHGKLDEEQAKIRALFISTLEGEKPLKVSVESNSTAKQQ